MDPVEESDDDQYLDFVDYLGHIADGHGLPQMNDDMWDDVYNDYMGDDDEGVWGYNGSDAEDYLDDYFLDHSDFYDSDADHPDDEYFTWEDDSPELEDRHLTEWSGPARPGQMLDDQMEDSTPANSLIGPSWGRIKAARLLMYEDLRENEQVSYEQLFTLVVHTEKMMAAWKKRMEKTGISWKTNRESFKFTAKRETDHISETDTEEDVREADDALSNLKLNEETEIEVIYKEPTSASERVQYSVEKLVDMLGSSLQLDELTKNINELKNWVQKHLMESVNSCLPLSLPYPALAALFKSLYSTSESSHEDVTPQLGFINTGDVENLMEEKYLVRLYLSLADVYNVFREIMFRRPAVTCRKDFKLNFQFILSRIEPNFTSIKTLHDQSTNESNIPGASGPTKQTFYCQNETISPVTDAALSNKFIVTIYDKANPSNGQLEIKPDIKIVNTETNQIEKEFSLEIEPHSKDLASKGLIYRSKSTISVAENLILYGVLFTDHDGNTWPSVECDTKQPTFYVWRWVVVDWTEARVIQDMIVPKEKSKRRVDSTVYPPKLYLSKFGTNIWILEESWAEMEGWNIDEIDWAQLGSKFLRVYDAGMPWHGNGNPKVIFENSNIVDLKENFVVISTKVDCDDEKLTCIKWINLLTLEVISEDLYRENKEPTIWFDKNDHVQGESVKFVQVNESGKTDIWKIDLSGRKEILLRLEPQVEASKFRRDGFDSLRYFHPYLLSVNNTENISDEYRLLNSVKITVHDLKENASPPNVIFLNTSLSSLLSFHAYGFHTLSYPGDLANLHIDLDGNSVVTMTKEKKRIDNFYNHDEKDLTSKWSRFEFSKAESDVMAEDLKSATNILRKIESEKLLVHELATGEPVVHNSEIGDFKDQQSGACGWLDPRGWTSNQTFDNRNIQDFSKSGERIVGELMDWDGSSGFLQLDSLENSPKISLHISNIRNPVKFVKAGIKFEVSVTENTNGKYYEAVEAKALN